MPTIADLDQRNPGVKPERTLDLEALYRGDELFEQRLGHFLPKWEREPDERYGLRKQLAHYRNYLGAVIDYFAALLFAGKPNIVPRKADGGDPALDPDEYYAKFREDCDGNGQDLELFFKERLTEAMVHRCSWFAIEHEDDGGPEPGNKKEFEKRGLGDCELCSIPLGEVYDWECDDDGRLEWVLVHSIERKRQGLNAGRNQVVERWKHYLPDRVDVYRVAYEADKRPAKESVLAVDPAESYSHRFGIVPVFCLEVPVGLWAANRLKTPQLAHFRASNAQTWSLSTSCYAMMLYQVEDADAFGKMMAGPAKGIVMGKEEKASWIAPPAAHFGAMDEEIKAQKDEIFRLAHQMALGVENNAAAIGRSAESKASDSESTRVILEAYGELVVEVMERVFDLVSAVRGDKYEWSVDGLGNFSNADIGGLMNTLESLDKIGGIPSKTFNVELTTQLAEGILPDLDETKKIQIRKEIEANTPDGSAQDQELEQAVRVQQALHSAAGLDDPATQGKRARPKAAPGAPGNGNGAARPAGPPSA
jgi:hypothetical protein